jgi:hypothetical protein
MKILVQLLVSKLPISTQVPRSDTPQYFEKPLTSMFQCYLDTY